MQHKQITAGFSKCLPTHTPAGGVLAEQKHWGLHAKVFYLLLIFCSCALIAVWQTVTGGGYSMY